MTRREPPNNSKLTKILIHQGFNQRRKKLRNTLSQTPKRINRIQGWFSSVYKDAFKKLDSDLLDMRPEELEIDDWLEIASKLEAIRESMG